MKRSPEQRYSVESRLDLFLRTVFRIKLVGKALHIVPDSLHTLSSILDRDTIVEIPSAFGRGQIESNSGCNPKPKKYSIRVYTR